MKRRERLNSQRRFATDEDVHLYEDLCQAVARATFRPKAERDLAEAAREEFWATREALS